MLNQTLADLSLTQTAIISRLHSQGKLRRRLLDLGFSPGIPITALFRSPLGDPTAYRIMDSVIALRQEDAKQIEIEVNNKGDF